MVAIYEFVRNIAVYMIFAGIAGVLAPEGKLKSYVDMTMNVILVLMLIQPIAGIFKTDFTDILSEMRFQFDTKAMAGEYVYYDEKQNEMILSAYQNNLKEQLRRLLAAYNDYDYVDAYFTVGKGEADFGEIKEIWIEMTEEKEQGGAFSGLIRIEPVRVRQGTGKPAETFEELASAGHEKIKNAVSDFYNIPSSNIYITVLKTD
ncbi:MAG: stage III sporulation protein AF [Defluviitaleaceae bacterium]|nr:stage III sporulation protein AF [Defluviitaleaceae bacterium]